jgi:hypothetical protein
MSPGIGGAQAGDAALGSGDNARTDSAIVTGLGSLAKRIKPLLKFEWVAMEEAATGKPELCGDTRRPLTSH